MSELEIIRPRRETWLRRAIRSITLGPYNPKDASIARLFGGSPSSSGVPVNEQTAMNYSAVWAAVNLIASHIASVPLVLYKVDQDGGKTRFKTHPIYRLIHDRPNPQMGSAVFRRTLQAHKLIWGNGYAEIERDQAGRPVALWPLMPYAVQPYIDRGVLQYRVYNPSGNATELAGSDMLHIRGLGGDGTCGQSVIPCARESLGLGIAAERFGATFFGNGSTFGGVISYPPGLGGNPQVRDENRKAIEKIHQGVDRAHRFLALYEGAKYETLGVPPNAAQFLETREFQIEEVCRWFNVPPHKLKHLKRSTNNNIEHQSIEYVTDTLDPHWVDWEEELTIKLVAPLERTQQLIEHVREGLLRGDSAGRGEFYSKLFSVAAITPNEIRARENLNPIAGGDTVYVPLNTLPLDRLGEYYDAIINEKKAKADPPDPAPAPPPMPVGATEDEKKAWKTAILEARQRAQLAEDGADLARAERSAAAVRHAADLDALAGEVERMRQGRDWFALDSHEARVALDLSVQEVGILKTRADALEQRVVGAEARLVSTADQLTAEMKARTQAEADRDAAVALMASAEQERDAANRDALAQAESVTLAQMARDAAQAERTDAIAAAAVDHKARLFVEAEAETLRTDLARARADLATELEKASTQRGVMLAAMRSLFAEATERLLAKESNAARKQQASGEKLRAWVDRFYPLHEETARDVFRPLVGPWTAIAGGAPCALLDRLVIEHVSASMAAMRLIAESENDDERAAAMERTLSRWESERADVAADRLLQEGMAGHG